MLDLLFQFVYPKRHPDLKEVEFTLLAQLAEAAEKYEVYAAMQICKVRMDCVRFVVCMLNFNLPFQDSHMGVIQSK